METADRYNENMATDSMSPANDEHVTVAAVFADRDRAHDAAHQLHDEGFRETWIGIARRDSDEYADTAPARPAVAGIPGEYVPGEMPADYDIARGIPDASEAWTPASSAAEAGDRDLAGSTRVESDNWFMRFFGEGDESLHDALVRHGVNEADASAAGSLPAHSAILTVDGANHPELAAQIMTQAGGRLITRGFGATGYRATGAYDVSRTSPTDATAAVAAPRTTSLYDEGLKPASSDAADRRETIEGANRPVVRSSSPQAAIADDSKAPDATAYDDYGRFRAGSPIDESTRLQLREERLRVDKSSISRGEATVGTDVITEQQDLDVPFTREELFVERRPPSNSTAAATTPIGGNDVIRIPLNEERVTVTKVPVVTEEVVVGKRSVQDTEHISETTRRESLNVSDPGAAASRDPRS